MPLCPAKYNLRLSHISHFDNACAICDHSAWLHCLHASPILRNIKGKHDLMAFSPKDRHLGYWQTSCNSNQKHQLRQDAKQSISSTVLKHSFQVWKRRWKKDETCCPLPHAAVRVQTVGSFQALPTGRWPMDSNAKPWRFTVGAFSSISKLCRSSGLARMSATQFLSRMIQIHPAEHARNLRLDAFKETLGRCSLFNSSEIQWETPCPKPPQPCTSRLLR